MGVLGSGPRRNDRKEREKERENESDSERHVYAKERVVTLAGRDVEDARSH